MGLPEFHSPDFSLRQLQYVVAVAETGGFGTGAKRCGVSQPSLSAQIAKLEEALGVRLFDRDARAVDLTPAGRRLLGPFRQALAAAAAVEVAAKTLDDPYAVPVRVALIPTVAPYLLPAVVDILPRDPGPIVHWLELKTPDAEAALAERRVDAIVIADPPADPRLASRTLGWEGFVAAVPSGAPIPAPVPLDWLRGRDVLLLEDGHCLRDHTMDLCGLPAAQESPYRATSLPTLVQMVSSGLGISVLPQMAVALESGRAKIDVHPFAADTVGRTLRLVWRQNHPAEAILQEIATAMAAVVKDAGCVVRAPS